MTAPVVDQTMSGTAELDEIVALLVEWIDSKEGLSVLLVDLIEARGGDEVLDQVAAVLPDALARSFWEFCMAEHLC